MKTCIDKKLYKLTLEKMVIGVEEPILVKGIGELIAKIDSGNSGYNVIHGEDIVIQGDIINFKTNNKEGDERRVSKKIKDTIKINIGGGHIQDRYVIELDVKFGGEDYKKVPFSITNRSDNDHKVLISKDFVGKELEALIDVTKDNISNDGINVDYVTEGLLNGLRKLNNKIGQFADKAAEFNKRAGGEYTKQTYYETPEYVTDEVKALNNLKKQTEEDAVIIRKQLVKESEKIKDLDVPVEDNNIKIFKILDYTGGTNKEGDNANPQYKEHIAEALKNLNKQGKKKAFGNQKRDGIVSEAVEQPSNDNSETPNNKDDKDNDDPTKQVQGKEGMPETDVNEYEKLEAIFKDLENRNRAIFYIINFERDNGGNKLIFGENLVNNVQNVIDSWNSKIAQGKDWSFNAFKNAGAAIAKELEGKGGKGLFAFCTGKQSSRNVEFCSNPGKFNSSSEESNNESNENSLNEYVEQYNQLYQRYSDLGGKGEISLDSIEALRDGSPENNSNDLNAIADEYTQLYQRYTDLGGQGEISLESIEALKGLSSPETTPYKR